MAPRSDYSFGIPSVSVGVILTGMGGQAATKAVTALDSSSGAVLWTFAPKTLKPDRQVNRRVDSPKAVYVPDLEVTPNGRLPNGMTRMKVRVKDIERRIVPVPVLQPQAVEQFAHWKSAGLVVGKDRVYAEVGHQLVALDMKDSSVMWSVGLPEGSAVRSLVGTKSHLVYCISNKLPGDRLEPVWKVKGPEPDTYLVAVDLKDGNEVWRMQVPLPGNLAVANNRLYFTDGSLRVFGQTDEATDAATGSH